MDYKREFKKRILIADDEPIIKLALHHLLADNFIVKFANNGQEVLAMKLQNFDIIFTDINMPEIDGIEATKAIRARKNNIPIIGVTAQIHNRIKQQCLRAGMNEVVNKPLMPNDINNLISRWIKK